MKISSVQRVIACANDRAIVLYQRSTAVSLSTLLADDHESVREVMAVQSHETVS